MNKSNMTKMERLQSVLDRYGADRARWPANEHELTGFIKETPQAAKFYYEARAFDQLLDQGALPLQETSSDLQQSILTDFADLHADKDDVVVPFLKTGNRKLPATDIINSWMSAAAMAACFAVGMYLGGVGIGDWSLDLATDFANLASQTDQFAEIADALMPSTLEEELL
ncbi:MAG: hypothetical protein GY927_06880 [bacterium]|nr:hypothetical protein [bacterium]